ncbi:hypothetical protein C5Y96_10420 [Blastopirellula marina]|uniref:Uncharacterized protein n=1 Tax=Blastopirellula marina TaxID=124 RepID=A0A2S8FM35_9BACT|nr:MULTISPECIES: hypothetical protein [Pirellulaceae]PQO33259.1 hypothetical protein C5Y96_10420 [Blastopirellula marina]RCS52348.1 hypothetical protein DTL36_10430 [Bremerella cremea]
MQDHDAKIELARHAGMADDYYENGFLGCLRPYSGIREENFHAVVESLLTVGVHIASSPTIDRRIVEPIQRITTTTRRWGVEEDGMLVRNGLITPDDRLKLRLWVRILEDMLLDLLAGIKPHEAIHAYCEYVAQFGFGGNAEFIVPLLSSAIDADDVGDRIQGYCAAIARLGSIASPVSGALMQARNRNWHWYEPPERCAAEILGYIDQALIAINKSDP